MHVPGSKHGSLPPSDGFSEQVPAQQQGSGDVGAHAGRPRRRPLPLEPVQKVGNRAKQLDRGRSSPLQAASEPLEPPFGCCTLRDDWHLICADGDSFKGLLRMKGLDWVQ